MKNNGYNIIELRSGEKIFDWQGDIALISKERMCGFTYKYSTIVHDKVSVCGKEIKENIDGSIFVKDPVVYNGYNRPGHNLYSYSGIYEIRIAQVKEEVAA